MTIRKRGIPRSRGKGKNKKNTFISTIPKRLSKGKSTKSDVSYQDTPLDVDFPVLGKVIYTCENCKYWNGNGTCSKVKGKIDPKGSCAVWGFGRPVPMKNLDKQERKEMEELMDKE